MELMSQLPCLRCGEHAVIVSFIFKLKNRDVIQCMNCEASMYLAIEESEKSVKVCYDRYTRRYDLEHYDDSHPIVVKGKVIDEDYSDEDSDRFLEQSGPIAIFPRKKYFSKSELKIIWERTKGLCHLCMKKQWSLNERSRSGWHVDHVVPNASGGRETEKLSNFKIACAKCNLAKGKGYTELEIKQRIRELLVKFYRYS